MRLSVLCFFTLSAFAYAADYLSELETALTSADQNSDPVEMAEHIIRSGGPLWSPLGHRVMILKYTAGRYLAQHGIGYIFLQSPKLAASFVTGGGFSGVASTVARDVALEILEESIGSPAELCEDICNAAITQGLDDYETAYGIARASIENGSISHEDAVRFLKSRWGVFRLVEAEALYNDIISFDYSVGEQIIGTATERIIEDLVEDYQLRPGSTSPLPIAEFAFFLGDMVEVLEESRIGIMSYQPYLDYVDRMDALNQLAFDEMQQITRLSGGTLIPGEDEIRAAILASAERAVNSWPFVSPLDFHAPNNPTGEFYDPGLESFIDRYPFVSEEYLNQLYTAEKEEVSENWDIYSDYFESPAALVSIESYRFNYLNVKQWCFWDLQGQPPSPDTSRFAQAVLEFRCIRSSSWGTSESYATLVMRKDFWRADQANAWQCHGYRVTDAPWYDDRFIRNADGTITDSETDLQWMVGPDRSLMYREDDIDAYVSEIREREREWRLPSLSELHELHRVSLDESIWGHVYCPDIFVWSSNLDGNGDKLGLYFFNGIEIGYCRMVGSHPRVFLVREL